MLYKELPKKPYLTAKLTRNQAIPGRKVNFVPRNRNIACMSMSAAMGCIIDADSCDMCQPGRYYPEIGQDRTKYGYSPTETYLLTGFKYSSPLHGRYMLVTYS